MTIYFCITHKSFFIFPNTINTSINNMVYKTVIEVPVMIDGWSIITEAKEKTPDAWLAKWQRERPGGNQVDNVHTPVLSTDLSRKIWVRLNKICTRQCRYNKCIHRWKFRESPECDCGASKQSMQHLILDRQLRIYDGDLENFIKANVEGSGLLRFFGCSYLNYLI